MNQTTVLLFTSLVATVGLGGEKNSPADDPISYSFNGRYGQIEVGGPYVGTEFHESRPLPSRISFYYPVANSIDLSTDYWKRGESQPMGIGLRIGKEPQYWIGKEPWAYALSPHRVKFDRNEGDLACSISYEFCLNEPAMVVALTMRNDANHPISIDVCTYLRLSLRTCQTYARKDSAWTEYNDALDAIIARYDDVDLDRASLFVQNVGAKPVRWRSTATEFVMTDTGMSRWLSSSDVQFSPKGKVVPAAAFEYEMTLKPDDSLSIIQVVGSCRQSEVAEKARRLSASWRNEVGAYNTFVHLKSEQEAQFSTGDEWLDRSSVWARGILAANAHYLDGHVVPMPCPAEYNFFFTHDLLLTNLGAVNFDLMRVKRDLLYVASLSKDNIIPHAYYWRDDGFKTEYCTPDNWNHLWFVLVSASYLRHSMDDSTATVLYPLVKKSLEEILKQKKEDNLMYAFRPDWWDLGHVEGPRSYITILTIRALRDYAFMSATLKKNSNLVQYERLADAMQNVLQDKLWDAKAKYLINWNGEQKDTHYYMGSLLAPAFGALADDKARDLVATATKELVAPGIGVRAAMPPDFHTKESIAFFKFAGDEAGQPYYYINGGVWPHNNAWYALALKNVGRVDDAAQFVRTTMILDGVARSPMGIPAMYEYRYSDPSSKEFGKIDKPSFLWAGGFYLYTLYQVFGVKENEWNVSFAGPLPSTSESASYSLAVGKLKNVSASGKGKHLQSCMIDGNAVPSLVLPLDTHDASKIDVKFGKPATPYLESVNATLKSIQLNQTTNRLTIRLSSFVNHQAIALVVAPTRPKSASLDGKRFSSMQSKHLPDGLYEVTVMFAGSNATQILALEF